MPAQTVIKFRRDTAANWTTANPVLAAGEVGLETDTGLVKYGNGTLTWTALSYPSNSNITYLVRNNTAVTIPKGTLVAATGAEPSGRIDVAPFEVTGLQDSELRVMGIATANIASGVNGTVMSFGTLSGLDTRGTAASGLAVGDEDWAVGTILFAHPTVPGKLTSVRPKHDLAVAFTTVRHATAGQISIRIVPGNFHLEWMHDVAISSPATGDVLQYNGTDWVNSPVAVSEVTGLQTALDAKAPIANPTFTGTVAGVTKAMVGLGNVDNTTDANKPVSTATQAALDLKANLAAPTFTGNVVLPSTTNIGDVSAAEILTLDGVTSSVQTQLNARVEEVNGAVTTAATNLTVVRNITLSTADPTGGMDGDVWLKYTV